jgi:hypothetical protein
VADPAGLGRVSAEVPTKIEIQLQLETKIFVVARMAGYWLVTRETKSKIQMRDRCYDFQKSPKNRRHNVRF